MLTRTVGNGYWRDVMAWRHVLAISILLVGLSTQVSIAKAQQSQVETFNVYWNSTTFGQYNATNKYVIQANLNDQLVIFCPYSASSPEYYYIYYTSSATAANSCNLTADPIAFQLIQCTNQQSMTPFTLTLTPINPFYIQLAFQPGNTYYLFSTSTMQPSGVSNTVGGACATIGATVEIQMNCCSPDNTSGATSVSTTSRTSTASFCCTGGWPLITSSGTSRFSNAAPAILLSLMVVLPLIALR